MTSNRLANKVAVVTGAGSGIGRAIAAGFVAEGARVVCADIDLDLAGETAQSLGPSAVAAACDVSDPEAARATVALAVERFGALHVLINNAAVFIPDATVETVDLMDWNRALTVNLTGAMLMSKYAVPAMRGQGGSIVHVASQLGHVGKAGRGCYGATKAALIHLAKTMAIDHAAEGIRVNSLSPGPIATERVIRRSGGIENTVAQYAHLMLVGRSGRADEVMYAAVFLASDESSFVTGADLLVDGGYTAR